MATSKLPKKQKLNSVMDMTNNIYTTLKATPAQKRTQLDIARTEFILEKALTTAEKTIKSYNNGLDQAFKFIPTKTYNKNLNEWTQPDIDEVMENILKATNKVGKKLSDVTKETYLRNFRIFIKWCVEKSYVASNLFVRKYKAPQQPQKMYTESEIYKLAEEPPLMHKLSFYDSRNYTMTRVFIETGIRKKSLLNLRICDLDLDGRSIQIVRSKNKEIYRVTISEDLAELLTRYLSNRIAEDTQETDVPFCDQHQRQLSEFGITNIMKKYVESRGVKWRGIHAFRHSCATMMVKNGATIAEVAQQTGHKDFRQVENYARTVTSMSTEKFDRYSPLANMPKSKPVWLNQ